MQGDPDLVEVLQEQDPQHFWKRLLFLLIHASRRARLTCLQHRLVSCYNVRVAFPVPRLAFVMFVATVCLNQTRMIFDVKVYVQK